MKKLATFMVSFSLLTFYPALSWAFTGTLEKINQTGVLVLGHRESSIPFSYYDAKQNVVGYSQDYANFIVEKIKSTLNRSDIQVKLLPITSQNRIPLLVNGTYDLECGSTTNNLNRQRQVAFSNTFFIVATRLLVNKNSGITDFAQLAGKNVVVTSGTTAETMINRMNDEKKMNMRIITTKDHGDAFRTLESGRAVAFFIDDPLLAGERAKSKNPSQWEIVGTPQSYEAYGCMLRKDDPEFKLLIDNTIADIQRSGEGLALYQRWFTQPIPPRNLNLNFPISSEMLELFAHPNDRAMDDAQ